MRARGTPVYVFHSDIVRPSARMVSACVSESSSTASRTTPATLVASTSGVDMDNGDESARESDSGSTWSREIAVAHKHSWMDVHVDFDHASARAESRLGNQMLQLFLRKKKVCSHKPLAGMKAYQRQRRPFPDIQSLTPLDFFFFFLIKKKKMNIKLYWLYPIIQHHMESLNSVSIFFFDFTQILSNDGWSSSDRPHSSGLMKYLRKVSVLFWMTVHGPLFQSKHQLGTFPCLSFVHRYATLRQM